MDSKCVSLNFFALVKHEQPDEEEADDYADEQQDSANTDYKNLNGASLSAPEMPQNQQFWHAFPPNGSNGYCYDGAMTNCDGETKAIPYDETPPPKFVYTFQGPGRGRWTFSCQFTSADALDLFRKGHGMYQTKKDGCRYFFCSVKRCPYKMIGIENERQWWNIYDRNAHNHTVIPIGAKIGEKRNRNGRKRTVKAKCSMPSSVTSSANGGSTFTKSSSSSPKKQQNSPKANRPRIVLKLRWNAGGFLPDHSPNDSTAASSSSCTATADDCANMKVPKSETQPPLPLPQAKLFELAMCVQEMRQIAAGWNLLFREKRGSYLFLPTRGSKAFKDDGILLSLTDRGNHIRMDEFLALRLRKDKIQRWPKELGHATIMRLACEQCARLFASSS